MASPTFSPTNGKTDYANMTNSKTGTFDESAASQFQKMEQQKGDKEIAAWVKKKFDEAKLNRTPITNQWYVNLAMFKGDQYVRLNNGSIQRLPENLERIRMTINRIRPAIRTLISRYTSQKPTASVIPASNEDSDILAAEAGESLWEHLSEYPEFRNALMDAAFWVANTGVGYIKQEWDNTVFDKTANPKPDAKTGEVQPVGAYGCIGYTSPTPFNIFIPNLLERDIERQPYVIHAFTMTLEEAMSAWPELITKEHKPTVIGSSEIMQVQYLNLKGAPRGTTADSCLILEAWIKPGATDLFPKGGKAIIVDDVVVFSDDNGIPYNHGEYPFSKIDGVLSGTFYGTSVIEDLIPVQWEYNRTRSQMVEISNRMGNPGYFVSEGSVDTTRWKARPGQLIPVKPGFAEPKPIQTPPVPGYMFQNLEVIKTDIEDISGQHQVSKGVAPSGVTAATAISFLQEQDQSFESSTYQSIEMAIQKTAKQSLSLCVQYWDEPRLVKVAGTDQSFSVKYFERADIENGTDLRILAGSSMPQSPAAFRAYITDLINRGIIPADKGLEMLNMPNMRSYYNLIKMDENQANRENVKLQSLDPVALRQVKQQVEMQKQQFLAEHQLDENTARMDPTLAQFLDQFDQPVLPVNDWDNHEVHIFIIEKFMKSQSYEMLDPSVQDEFKKHREAHMTKMQEAQLNSLMANGVTNEQGNEQTGANPMAALMGGGNADAQAGAPQGNDNNAQGSNQFSGVEGLDAQQ